MRLLTIMGAAAYFTLVLASPIHIKDRLKSLSPSSWHKKFKHAGSPYSKVFDENHLSDPLSPSNPCTNVTVIWARGSGEPGNVGNLGPWYFDALAQAIEPATLQVQGIAYPGKIKAFLKGSHEGEEQMARYAFEATQRCPDTKIVLGGYSQGAQVLRNSLVKLDDETRDKIDAVVTFGDPRGLARNKEHREFYRVTGEKTDVVCHRFDDICQEGVFVLPWEHGTYSFDTQKAANWTKELLFGKDE